MNFNLLDYTVSNYQASEGRSKIDLKRYMSTFIHEINAPMSYVIK